MKVRWNERSVRLRITPDELARLCAGERLCERLVVGGWEAVLERAAETGVSVRGGVVTIALAGSDIARLSDPSTEGVYFGDGALRYYVEKDFPCAHPRAAGADEPATATFAPPVDFAGRKANG